MDENTITGKIIGAAIKINRNIGPGLLESVYQNVLTYELRKAALYVEEQVPMPLIYEQVKLEAGFRIDLIVEKLVIVELKAVDLIAEVHKAQTLTYLKLAGLKVGLLINFNSYPIKNQIFRFVNKL
ncbi:MAG: GxxExxY protein [Syntrophothermus sp.]